MDADDYWALHRLRELIVEAAVAYEEQYSEVEGSQGEASSDQLAAVEESFGALLDAVREWRKAGGEGGLSGE